MNKKLLGLCLLCFGGFMSSAEATRLVFSNENPEWNGSAFIIDVTDIGGDIQLQFGNTLGEYLRWDTALADFVLSDTLRVGGNLDITETEFTLDVDNTGAGNDVRIIAEQGTDNDGEIRYNSATNVWEASDNGGAFFELSSGWEEDGVTTSTILNTQIDGDLNVDGDIGSPCGPYGIFWAERGTVVSNASWALGNGQTPWGSPMGCAGKVTRFAAVCTASTGTSLGAEIRVNNASSACDLNVSTTLGQATTATCDVSFGANDIVGVYAQTEVGAWSECVGTFWVRYD